MATGIFEYGTPSSIGPKLVECQRNSYLRTFKSTVINCKEWSLPSTIDNKRKGKKNKKKKKKKKEIFYEIELKDTILFPDGGGQPSDNGIITIIDDDKQQDINILSVIRTDKNGQVLHKSNKPIKIGTNIEINVDWNRRYDHMQQHTGQHLISAIFRSTLNTPTCSWWMSEYPKFSSIEMEMKSNVNITNDDILKCEKIINDNIREHKPITVHIFHNENVIKEFSDKNKTFKQKSLAPGSGPLRVIEIPNVEYNTCCGTHLNNTSQLQMIKICGWNVNNNILKVNFIAGNRMFSNYDNYYNIDREMGKLLSCSNNEYVSNIDKLHKDIKDKTSQIRLMGKRLIELEVNRLKNDINNNNDNVKCIYEHFINGNISMFQNIVDLLLKEFNNCNIFIMFSCGQSTKTGQYIIATNKVDIFKNKNNKKKILTIIEGRGGGKPGRIQGKANNLKAYDELFRFIKPLYPSNKDDNNIDDNKTNNDDNKPIENALTAIDTLIDLIQTKK